MNVGKRVRHYRQKRGLSQEQLAKQLDITPTYLSHIELGKRRITVEMLVKISEILNISVIQLLDDVLYDEEQQAWISLGDELKEEGITPEQAKTWIDLAKRFRE